MAEESSSGLSSITFEVVRRRAPSVEIKELFAKIDKAQVPSGILLSSFLSIHTLRRYEGLGDAPEASQSDLEQQYYDLYSGLLPDGTPEVRLPSLEDVRARAAWFAEQDLVPIALINLQYSRPVQDAFVSILEAIEREAIPQMSLPLEEGKAFLASTLLPVRFHEFEMLPYVVYGRTVRFVLDESLWITNLEKPRAIEVDFGDGLGLRPVAFGEIVEVTYGKGGIQPIKLVAHFDGEDRVARTSIEVTQERTAAPNPNSVWTIQAPNGNTGKAYIIHGLENGKRRTQLAKPLLLIEGFPGGYSYEYLYEAFDQQLTLSRLISAGFDAVILSFNQGTDDIRRNAYVVIETVMKIIAVPGTGGEIPGVIAASMGGLVARFALATIEKNPEEYGEHGVSVFITYDSPHRGAYLNPGLQWVIHSFAEDGFADAVPYSKLIKSMAARQMLVFHVACGPFSSAGTDLGSLAGPGSPHDEFFKEYKALGFPKKTKNFAIANGTRTGQCSIPAGDLMLEWNSIFSAYQAKVWASQETGFVGSYSSALRGGEFLLKLVGFKNYDGAPGGLGSSVGSLSARLSTSWGSHADNPYPRNCFIPSRNALDLDGDLYQSIPVGPTDYYLIGESNTDHVEVTPAMSKFWVTRLIEKYATPPLRMMVVSDPGLKIHLASSFDGLAWDVSPTPLFGGWMPKYSPSVAEWGPGHYTLLVAAIPGLTGDVRVVTTSNCQTWDWQGGALYGGFKTKGTPAIAAFNPYLFMALHGEDGRVWVVRGWEDEDTGNLVWSSSKGEPVVDGWITKYAPSLAVFKERLYMTLPGGNGDIRVVSSKDGSQWPLSSQVGSPLFGGWVTGFGPSLAAFKDRLYMTLPGGNGQDLQDIRIVSTADGVTWSQVGDPLFDGWKTKFGPSLAAFGGRLYMTLPGGNGDLRVVASSDGATWENDFAFKSILGEMLLASGPHLTGFIKIP